MARTLTEQLRQRIARDGPIPVVDYMAACLGDRRHGYYRGGAQLGAGGDFTTAPEISQMFGELLGLWCAELWHRLGSPAGVRLVELGPGRGSLMADALRAVAAALPGFRAALSVHLVETSPGLRAIQAATLTDADATWHETLDQVPRGPILVLANEFFDALPIRQFVRVEGGWSERLVDVDPDTPGFRFATLATTSAVDGLLPAAMQCAQLGTIAETCPMGRVIVGEIARRTVADGGGALVVDYGPSTNAAGDSLQAVRRHNYHPVLAAPGEADLTAHVDFAGLLEAAVAAGGAGHGPISQRALLRRLGIEARLEKLLQSADDDRREGLVADYRRLTDADQMGSLFKAIAITAPGTEAPGFEP